MTRRRALGRGIEEILRIYAPLGAKQARAFRKAVIDDIVRPVIREAIVAPLVAAFVARIVEEIEAEEALARWEDDGGAVTR